VEDGGFFVHNEELFFDLVDAVPVKSEAPCNRPEWAQLGKHVNRRKRKRFSASTAASEQGGTNFALLAPCSLKRLFAAEKWIMRDTHRQPSLQALRSRVEMFP
jgi:hypothetical protein